MRNKIGNHMRIFAKLNIHILRDQNILNKTMDSIMDRILKHKQKNISFFSQIKKPLFLILSSAFLFSGCMVLRSHDSGYSSGSGKMQKTSSTINSTKGADDNDERFNVSQKTKLKQFTLIHFSFQPTIQSLMKSCINDELMNDEFLNDEI